MIAVNNVKVNLSDKTNAYSIEVNEGIKRIKQDYKFPLIFSFTNEFKRQVTIEMNYRNPGSNTITKTEYPAGKMIAFKETVNTPTSSEEWRYYERSEGIGDKMVFSPEHDMLEKTISIQETQIEKAFFFLFKSRFCKTSMNHVIKNSNTPKFFQLENVKYDAFVRVSNEMPRIKTESLIMVENKELPEKLLREIALSYGINALEKEDNPKVPGTTKYVLDTDECRVHLIDLIRNQYKSNKKAFEEFLAKLPQEEKEPEKKINQEGVSENSPMIKELQKKNIIDCVQKGAYKQWVYSKDNPDEEVRGKRIFTCSKGIKTVEEAITNFASYLNRNEEMKKLLSLQNN